MTHIFLTQTYSYVPLFVNIYPTDGPIKISQSHSSIVLPINEHITPMLDDFVDFVPHFFFLC